MVSAYNALAKRNGDSQNDSDNQTQALVPQLPGSQARFLRAVGFENTTLSGPALQKTLGQALDEYDMASTSKKKALEPGIYQQLSVSALSWPKEWTRTNDTTWNVAWPPIPNSVVRRK
jgi:hypothetical protein